MASRHEGDHYFTGHVSAGSMTVPAGAVTNSGVHADAAIARSKLEQNTLAIFPVDLNTLRVWDAYNTVLASTPGSADDLALVGGTFGTAHQLVQTGDVKATTTTRYARFQVPLPAEYDDGETVQIRLYAGMETTVADTSALVDVVAYEIDGTGGISADLVTTAATTANSLTYANVDFTLTATSLVAGDILDVRIAFAVTDGATATAVIGSIGKIALLCDIRG
jgi:hypothetical protein